MNELKAVFLAAILIGALGSVSTSQPFTEPVLNDNEAGWFTVQNINEYGDDLDARSNGSMTIFTGHPAYVMNSQNVSLLFDMPRIHYFASTFNGTPVANQLYSRLSVALRNGTAKYTVMAKMTANILRFNKTVYRAFKAHYCSVDDEGTTRLYDKTDATLYRWVPDSGDCAPENRLQTDWEKMDDLH